MQAIATRGQDPLDRITELVDVALVSVAEDEDCQPRVVLLGSVRDFAREELVAEEEDDDARLRHAEYFVAAGRDVDRDLHTPRDLAARGQLEREYDNIREALTWTLKPDEAVTPSPHQVDLGLRLARYAARVLDPALPGGAAQEVACRAAALGEGRDSVTMAAVLASQHEA